ncbi:MAG: ribosomal subunit interface protein [Candidatus Magasanikbacteria bacterium CG11_big_fil_rev_8_21_14_0_20_39_34]|uniref:Ribosomal subunit interface protein n=1 Tax=Candidatus Magasanikbacteria bacterium CG11_big_fil_rev_8_21_14_0_20_39_34 TaxID=1974653 RepID=A0A2H0N536_9BACT|nr:MAG: ribosomal subunit interface protein [Candidatus Magasanikbacteria bacterium CG11_big_fil_rev_8_21_14_0_20_39_34]
MTINVKAVGVDMTDALHTYTKEKFETLTKFFDNIIKADVTIGKNSDHHQNGDIFFAHATLQIPNHGNLYVEKTEQDLYKAIDKVKDHLKIELEKLKGHMRAKDKDIIREQKAYQMEND